mgnify:CR=1 FL=1
MLNQMIIYLILTLLVVIFSAYFHGIIKAIDSLYVYTENYLSTLFTHNHTGSILVKMLALLFIPLIIAAIPALLYRLIKGKEMPYFLSITWFLWLIIVLTHFLIR